MVARLLLLGLFGLAASPVLTATSAPARPPQTALTRSHTSAYAILAAPGGACRDTTTEPEPCGEPVRPEPPRRAWPVTPGVIVP